MKKRALISSPVTRRDFVRTSLMAGAVAPLIVPSRLFGAQAPSNRIRVGHIGCGRIALAHDMPGVFRSGMADIVGVCDVDAKRTAAGKAAVQKFYSDAGQTAPEIDTYGDYRELVARKDIDAIVISTPDHSHAELAIAALAAGKDVYLQKPMTMTHAESILLRDAVKKYNRVFQLGSQQRSWPAQQFRKACEFVRSGRVGQLRRVEIGLPIDPTKPDDPEQPVPQNLNYDAWLGPTPQVYYTEQRVHSQADIGSRPGWLRNDAYCLGMITGWGAHHFDTAHWGMDTELTGPIKAEGKGEFPSNKIWNVHGKYRIHLTYPRGIEMTVSDELPNGVKFIGDDGWIFCTRESESAATSSDPQGVKTSLKPLDASDPKLLDPSGKLAVEFLESRSHHKNWLDCVRSRKDPLSPAPVAHRANAACIVSWIAMKLGRPLTWDANAEKFVNDAEANAMLSRPERAPYGAFRLAKTLGLT